MKSLISLALILGTSAIGNGQAVSPAPVATPTISITASNLLPEGTPVRLRLTENLSSASNATNDRVSFEVLDAVKVNNVTIIAQGGTALGTVTLAEAKRRMGKSGKLDVIVDNVRMVNGKNVSLTATRHTKGDGHGVAVTTGVVAGALLFWPAAPFFLLMHGKDIQIPKGTEITAFTSADTELNLAQFAPVAQAGQ